MTTHPPTEPYRLPSTLVGLSVVLTLVAGLVLYASCLWLQGVDLAALLASAHHPSDGIRNSRWARPMPPTPGVTNFFQVSAALYRGAQPTAEGFNRLKMQGIRTVVSLRQFHGDRELLAGLGFRYVSIPTNALSTGEGEIVAFLRVLADPDNHPVFVHCAHGADRTGTVCAAYRIVVQHWSKEDAIREMTRGGYGFHRGYGNLVETLRKLDVARIREQLAAAVPRL